MNRTQSLKNYRKGFNKRWMNLQMSKANLNSFNQK